MPKITTVAPSTLSDLAELASDLRPIRVAVVSAAQDAVLETLRMALEDSLVEPRLIGDPDALRAAASAISWDLDEAWITPADGDQAAAALGVRLVHEGEVDALMKGYVHTDTLMHALLDKKTGLRLPGRRVSHVFVTDIPAYPKLLSITDAAVNITPDLGAKAQIVQNAVEVAHMLGIARPKVAALSAVETVNPAITSTLDAAALAIMARRGQIADCVLDGPLAFDNAISARAAREKGIASEVAGDADIVLVPDLVSGNILAKNLEYLDDATAAGILVGLAAPVVLSSRADPPPARLAGLAFAALIHHRSPGARTSEPGAGTEPSFHCAPQAEHACCPLPA
jgi:phosphate acetyltransferase